MEENKIKFGFYFAQKWIELSEEKKKEIAHLLKMDASKVEEIVKLIIN